MVATCNVALPQCQEIVTEPKVGAEKHKAGTDAETVAAAAGDGVLAYEGFTEHCYRLLFAHENHFPGNEPAVVTIPPSGVIETSCIATATEGNGLIAYGYPQSLDHNMASKKVEVVGSPLNGMMYSETPFVANRTDGSLCLVHTWPTSYNDAFKSSFKISACNPNVDKFIPQAVTEFEECMVRLFGDEARRVPVVFCQKATLNASPAYVGKAEKLIELLTRHPEIMQELSILKVSGHLSFVAAGKDGDGTQFEVDFSMTEGQVYVMYQKCGWEIMGCVKEIRQFMYESEFNEPPRFL